MSQNAYDFTRLSARNGEIVISAERNPIFHENGVPKRLIFSCDLWIGSNQYLFEVERELFDDWRIRGYGGYSCWDDSKLTLITPAVRREFAYRQNWSYKAQQLLEDNLRSLKIYFDDPTYCEGLLLTLKAAWTANELELQRRRIASAELAIEQLELELATLAAQGAYLPEADGAVAHA
jgi:hypothetical protein